MAYDISDFVEDFSLQDIEGNTVRLSDYKDRHVLLFFFATWCPYCGAEAPYLQKNVREKFEEKDLKILAIDVKESAEIAKPWPGKFGWTFPVLVDDKGDVFMDFAPQKKGLAPEVAIINAHFLLDKSGKIIYKSYLNMEKFDADVKELCEKIQEGIDKGD